MVDVRFGVLGPTQVWRGDGGQVAVGGPRLRALLARLLLAPGRTVAADRLIDDLYGAEAPSGAANALQSQVSRLRRALPEPVVERRPAGYRLAVDPDQVDLARFTRLAGAGRRALVTGDHAAAMDRLTEALRLWRGPALADVRGAPFAAAQVARLEELRLAATEDRLEAALALDPADPPVAELRELVAAYPLRGRLRGLLMRALTTAGRQGEALAVFDDTRRLLAEELGIDPSPQLAAVHRAVLRGEYAPPARSVPPAEQRPAPAVPAQLTSFLGREEELERVVDLLAEARLVTITGPGGAGKTRLAIELAGRHPAEVGFVELAPVVNGAEVAQTVLTALGLREARLRGAAQLPDATDRLVAALADRRLLLVLDNCEHLLADTATLVSRLLSGCPGLRVVATSRQALGLTGEALCPLSGLAVPPPDASPEAARDYPALRLLADRAADVVPGFSLDPPAVAVAAQICRTLDGLPLAIELAAARLRALPMPEVAARLNDRFRLLSRGSRGAQHRHQTLRAVVEWSWELLDEPERTLARRLTVFAGGADLAAVERVCAAGDDTVDILAGLVDKSLVEVVNGRYRMLETIRAYGAERLAEAGETEAMRRAHAAYFLDLAEAAAPHLRRAEQLTWLSRLDGERDNLHQALRRATAAGDHETALRLVSALSFYWWLRGVRSEGALLAGELLAAIGPQPPPGRQEEYLLCELLAALGGGRRNRTVGVTRLPLRRPPRQPFLLYLSSIAAGPPAGDVTELRRLIETSRAVLGDDRWSHALTPVGFGLALAISGELAEGEAELRRAVAGFRALGERWGTMIALANLAEVVDWRGGRTEAAPWWDEARALAEELDSTVDMSDLLRARGTGALAAGDLDGAQADFEEALRLARRAGAPELVAAARCGLAELARLRGDAPAARSLAEQALAECPEGWFIADGTRLELLVLLGRIAEADGEAETARGWYRQAAAAPPGWWSQQSIAEAERALTRLARRG